MIKMDYNFKICGPTHLPLKKLVKNFLITKNILSK